MPGVGVADRAALEIEDGEGERHEGAALGGAIHQLVEAPKDCALLGILFDQRGDRRLDHGHHQARRQPVAGDVADGHGQARLVEVEDVVVVAAYRRGGLEVRGERHAAELRPFLRQQVALDGGGDLDLALQALLLRHVGQQRGDRLGHAVERLRHLAELVVRAHGDAVREVAALHRLRPLLDAVDRAGDGVDQHRREHDGDEVDEDEGGGQAEDELEQNAEIAAPLGAEVKVEQAAPRIDDQRPELVRARAAGVPLHGVGDVGPDDLSADGVEQEIVDFRIAVHVAHDHAAALLELVGPGAVERLHEDRRAPLLRKLVRYDQQHLSISPNDAAEARLLQPLRQPRAAGRPSRATISAPTTATSSEFPG